MILDCGLRPGGAIKAYAPEGFRIDEIASGLGLSSSSYDPTGRLRLRPNRSFCQFLWTVRHRISRQAEFLRSKLKIEKLKIPNLFLPL